MSYFEKFNREGIPFMEGREKDKFDNILGRMLHVDDFGFIEGKDGQFAVVCFQEIPQKFYFANNIITEMLKEVQNDGMKSELRKQTIVFDKRVSQNNRPYMSFKFVF